MLWRRAVLLMGMSFLFQGCLISKSIQVSAVGYNRAVEESENQTLLLNIIRAKDRRPMYMTGISQVTGSVKEEFTLMGSIPFQNLTSMTATRTATPGGTFNMNPTFTVGVLTNQEFMRGFLTAIDSKTVFFFWAQGWAPELLLHLFVAKVEKSDGTILINRPDSPYSDKFSEWVNNLVLSQPQITKVTTCQDIGPIIPKLEGADILTATEDGLTVDKVPDGFQLRKRTDELVLIRGKRESEEIKKEKAALEKCAPSNTATEPKAGVITASSSSGEQKADSIRLRAPEGVLYYLGELMRAEERGEKPIQTKLHQDIGDSDAVNIFVALDAAQYQRCDSIVSVSYDGRSFFIPSGLPKGCTAPGRSMQALSLLSELISLQKSATTLPTTSTVRAISQ